MRTTIDDPVILPAASWTKWWKPMLGVALALVLCGAGWTVFRVIDGTTAPVETVNALLADLKQGQLESAARRVGTPSLRGPDSVSVVLRQAPVMAQNDGFFMRAVSFRDDHANVEGALITRSGPVPAHFRLYRAQGNWRVVGIDLPGQQFQL